MKLKAYLILLTGAIVVLLWELGDRLPPFLSYLLLPGSFVTVLINGNLHDRVMPGFVILVILLNWIFYSAVVLAVLKLLDKFRTSK